MPFRPDRRQRASGWLEWKVAVFTIGAGLALAGIGLGRDGLVTAAIVVLAVGVALRFIPGRSTAEDEPAVDHPDGIGEVDANGESPRTDVRHGSGVADGEPAATDEVL